MLKRGDLLYAFWSSRGPPAKFHWPLLWAVGCGFAIQTIWGIFPVIISFVLLAGADEGRCPLAAPLRPFFGFVMGAVSAVLIFNWCLLWGIFFSVHNPKILDPFLISREWWNWPYQPIRRPENIFD
mmetsp:Transcript_16250/g.32839  ORF Transcript_16250/g.32839 Transcript_16250/m.32839 type:complete len:126 (+) Transcript_16250:11-388(+)